MHLLGQGFGAKDKAEGQIVGYSPGVERGTDSWITQHGFELRGKDEAVWPIEPVEALRSPTVVDEHKLPGTLIENSRAVGTLQLLGAAASRGPIQRSNERNNAIAWRQIARDLDCLPKLGLIGQIAVKENS